MQSVKQQDTETMAGLKESFKARKEKRENAPARPVVMVKDPKTGKTMTKAEYQEKYTGNR
mgnify:FL=1